MTDLTGTFKHTKTGNLYTVIMEATNEANLEKVVIYARTEDGIAPKGRAWSRPKAEFLDRFEAQ